MAGPRWYDHVIDILVVCTGNVCRSPMAAALLGGRLAAAGVPASVTSAGLLDGGSPPSPGAVAAMAARGIDITGHRSRALRADMLAGVDLVLGMAAEHVRESAVLLPSAWPRAFTLKELVRRAVPVGMRTDDEELGEWLAHMHRDRRPGDLVGDSTHDDIADPIGMSHRAYRATAAELDRLLAQLVELAWAAPIGASRARSS